MKFAVCNEIFESNPVEPAYQFAKQLGFDGLEVAPFTLGEKPVELSKRQRREFAKSANDHGLEIVGLHWLLAKTDGYHLTTNNKSVQQRTVEYFRRLIELCADLSGKVMVLGSPLQRNFVPPMTNEEAMHNAATLIAQWTDSLTAHDVILAIEPLGPSEGNFLNRASDGVELIKMIGHPNVRLHLDVKAMSSEPTPVDQIILQQRDYLAHFHANDPNRLGPGMGDFDQRPVFDALKQIDYNGWVSVEVFDFALGYESILSRSFAAMQNAIASL